MRPLSTSNIMNTAQTEILNIAQEECAEVIQAISKINRFGIDAVHNNRSNRDHLEEEIGDLVCMLQLMEEKDVIDWTRISMYATLKREKLKQWSTIFEVNTNA